MSSFERALYEAYKLLDYYTSLGVDYRISSYLCADYVSNRVNETHDKLLRSLK